MKKLLFLLLVTGLIHPGNAQTTPVSNTSTGLIHLKENSFDFGKIQQNRPVTHVFEIINTGKEPVKLDNVQASCGCTTPEWSPEPIAAGASSTIKVGYNAASEGPFSKSVAVQYNGNQTATIMISGTVFKGPATSAPVNSSITLLKQTNK